MPYKQLFLKIETMIKIDLDQFFRLFTSATSKAPINKTKQNRGIF